MTPPRDATRSGGPPSGGAPEPGRAAASLQGVSRTLLIPLYARAHAPSLLPGLQFEDPVARRVADELGLGVADVGRDKFTMRLCIARSAALQRALAGLLDQGPRRPVVLLACGLDTLPLRPGGPRARWLCTDLPAVMRVRDRVLPPVAGIDHAAGTLPDDLAEVAAWLDGERPIFVLEGVLPYLDRTQAVQTLARLAELAPKGGDLLLDGYHPALLAFARFGDGFRRMRVRFRFGIADTREYASLAPRLRHHAETDLLALLPWHRRLRTQLPALAAAGRPLASLAHLEITAR